MPNYVSRAGDKLAFALEKFKISALGKICADLGCSTGGFTDCLLQLGAAKVYSVDTGYGVLAYKLRNNPRVVVLERTNALHVHLPEKMDLISIDVGWTPQRLILPHARSILKPGGEIVSLLKPHYEIKKARLNPEESEQIAQVVQREILASGSIICDLIKSPLVGQKGGNIEYLLHVLY